MAHSMNQNIRESISCTTGMESLIGQKYQSHLKCPSCMIGKATLEDFPSLKRKVVPPLFLINMDSFSSSVKSSVVASAGETDRDLAGRQFPRNCLPYNIIEF
jgi:hypothetical protein